MVPSNPSNLQITSDNGRISLLWQSPVNTWGSLLTNYKIYRGSSPGNTQFLATVGNVANWTDNAVSNGQVYYYTISAVTAAGEGDRSSETSIVAGLPSAPQTLQATSGDGQVLLAWSAPASDGGSPVTNYKVYRGTTAGNETLVTTIGNVATWTDTGLTNGQIYYYTICTVNAAGDGPQSNEASATPASSPGSSIPGYSLEITTGAIAIAFACLAAKSWKKKPSV